MAGMGTRRKIAAAIWTVVVIIASTVVTMIWPQIDLGIGIAILVLCAVAMVIAGFLVLPEITTFFHGRKGWKRMIGPYLLIVSGVGLTVGGSVWLFFVRNPPAVVWRFDAPVTLFMYGRTLGYPVQINAVQIHGTNNMDRPLSNAEAQLVFDTTGQQVRMQINPHGLRPPNPDASLIPPEADFDITYGVPSKTEPGKHGITSYQFLAEYGGFTFTFKHDGTTFSRHFDLSYIEKQIAFIDDQTKEQAR